ncbi:MAG TPA: class III extradiol dioxygenase family protein [Candidatus Binataceae bacterium]|nr:class III extradiol dioxygenase family protein [Candidatus Binataceae bacterium]
MARIIGGIGTSHIPLVGAIVDRGLQDSAQWKPFFDSYQPMRRWLAEQRPEVAIVVYNDHGADFFLDKMPTFALGLADHYPPADEGWGVRPLPALPGDPDLSWHLAESLIEQEFDLTLCQELRVDHGLLVPMNLLWGSPQSWPVRIVPLQVNVLLHPIPTAARCLKLGQALGRAVASFAQDYKVVIVGTGGMSHQLHGARGGHTNPRFDNFFLEQLERDPAALAKLSRRELMEEAGAEGVELIMWLIMRGALEQATRFYRSYYGPVSVTAAGSILFVNG